MDAWESVDLSFDAFIQCSKVTHPSHPSILLRDDEGGRQPLRGACSLQYSNFAESFQLSLKDCLVALWNGVWLGVYRFYSIKEFQVYFGAFEDSQLSCSHKLTIEETVVFLKEGFQLILLACTEM